MTKAESLGVAIANRRTHKVLGKIEAEPQTSILTEPALDGFIADAGNAPYHYACDRIHVGELSSPVPWRAHKLNKSSCRWLMQEMLDDGDVTKIPNMLAAAECLIQVTWLPDAGTIKNAEPGVNEAAFDGTLRNMEHIAAASAFIQSFLLVCDQAGFRTYWSSGGPLRSAPVFEKLGIPDTQLLLGSVFLFPQDPGEAEIKAGSMAEKRGNIEQWSRWVG